MLKNVVVWAGRIERRSIYQYHNSGIPTYLSPSSIGSLEPTVYTTSIYHTLGTGSLTPTNYGGIYSNSLAQTIEDDNEPYYHHGPRILKQYLVHERPKNEAPLDQHFGNPFRPYIRVEARQLPYGGAVEVPVLVNNDLEPKLHPFKPNNLLKNHGPIALGSGSLGYISLPNGNVYLGSGSLGYLSQKQHYDSLTMLQTRPFIVAGPLHFGTSRT